MPDEYYTHQYSGEEIDAAVGRAAAGGALDKRIATFVNPNLLINGDFRAGCLVNQRGQTEYTGAAKYSLDMWWLQYNTNLSIVDGGVKITGQWELHQYLEKALPNGTYTLSLLFMDRTGSDTLRLTSESRSSGALAQTESEDASGLLSMTFTGGDYDTVSIGFVGAVDNAATLVAVKLELGDTQTLAHQDSSGNWVLNEVPNYADTLRECQRYFVRIGKPDMNTSVGMGQARSTLDIIFNVPTPVTMRTSTAVKVTGAVNFRHGATYYIAGTANAEAWGQNSLLLGSTVTTPEAGAVFDVFLSAGQYLDIIAEL